MSDKPIPESYWVLPGQFLAGEYPALLHNEHATRERLLAFLAAGFKIFIDLTSPGDRPPYQPLLHELALMHGRSISHQRFSFPDYGIPPLSRMTAALDAIDLGLAGGGGVYVHCVGGIGRTGTTVACWLIRHGLENTAALTRLQELYRASEQSLYTPHSPESDQQTRFILEWKEHGLA
jgi:hypothetical protein